MHKRTISSFLSQVISIASVDGVVKRMVEDSRLPSRGRSWIRGASEFNSWQKEDDDIGEGASVRVRGNAPRVKLNNNEGSLTKQVDH